MELNGYGTVQRKRNLISQLITGGGETKPARPHVAIGMPEDFRCVSAIIDVDILPETQRRVKLMKNGVDRPLGFYIRDGVSIRVTPTGLEKVPGIFISRLVPGGLAEGTGLLAVNDEVLEVNGIDVAGKTLDQVTDMMVANSSNLIVTVKPVNQHNNVVPRRGGGGSSTGGPNGSTSVSQKSSDSFQSARSYDNEALHEDDEDDEIQDHLKPANVAPESMASAGAVEEEEVSYDDSSLTRRGSPSLSNNGSKRKYGSGRKTGETSDCGQRKAQIDAV